MNRTLFLAPWLMLALTLSACQPGDHHAEDDGHGHGHGETAHDDEMVKGPNGGRLLEDGDFTLELAIVEDGVPPEYRAWATFDGEALAPDAVTLTVELSRLDGETNSFASRRRTARCAATAWSPSRTPSTL